MFLVFPPAKSSFLNASGISFCMDVKRFYFLHVPALLCVGFDNDVLTVEGSCKVNRVKHLVTLKFVSLMLVAFF